MKNILVFYHDDLDGMFSAGIILRRYEDEYNVTLQKVNYGDDFEKLMYETSFGDFYKVFVVDFAFPNDIMQRLYEYYEDNFIWIDHHITAIERLADLNTKIKGDRDIANAGCGLTWRYLFPNEKIPKIIQVVQDVDLWLWEINDSTNIINALSVEVDSPIDARHLIDIGNFEYDELWSKGDEFVKLRTKQVNKSIDNGKETYFYGEKAYIVNSNHNISEIGSAINNMGYTVAIIWSVRKNKIIISLRSQGDTDVSIMAQSMGGGGHRNASGFELPLTKIDWITTLIADD